MPVQTRIQIRRGTTSEWIESLDPLAQGELGYDLNLKKFKVGDGSTLWSSLPWATIIGSDLVGTSGINISYTSNSGIATVSVTGLTSSYLSDFASAVSGLLPVKSVLAGNNITITPTGDNGFVISSPVNDNTVKDIIGSSVTGVSGVSVVYDNSSKITTISLSDPSIQSTDVTDFNSAVSGLVEGKYARLDGATFTGSVSIPSGTGNFNSLSVNNTSVSLSGHSHVATDITNFNSAVSGLLGVKSLTGTSGIGITNNGGNQTIAITGIPSSLIIDLGNIATTEVVGRTGVMLTYDSITDTMYIDTTGVSFVGHTHSWSDVTDASQKASLTELSYLSGVTPGTTSASRALVVDSSKDLTGLRNLTTEGNVTVGGNLVVQGTTTTVNSTTVDIGDNIIRVNTSGLNTGGMEVFTGSDTKSLVWNVSNNRWEFTGADIYTTGTVSADSLQVSSNSLVTNLNADLLDGQHGSYYRDFVNLTGVPSPVITGTLTGDLSGTGTVTLNQLGNGTLSISANIVAGSIVDSDISSSAAINVTKLSSSGITLGSTTVNLGNTASSLVGLSSISGASAGSPTTLYYCVIDGGTP